MVRSKERLQIMSTENSTLENALYNYARNMLPSLTRSYETGCNALVIQECKNILSLAEKHDIQNGTEFTMLSDQIKKIEAKYQGGKA